METPNTRSRQKREQVWSGPSDSQEETGKINWVSAEQKRLKKMMAEAEAHSERLLPILPLALIISQRLFIDENLVEIRLPEPSQKPAFFHTPNPVSTSAGLSSSRPRKRPCRGNRSLPSHSLSTESMTVNIGERSNSAPGKMKTEDDVELDELLNLAMKTISVKTSMTPVHKAKKSLKENTKISYSLNNGAGGESGSTKRNDDQANNKRANALQEQQINNPSPRRSIRQTPSKLLNIKSVQSTDSQSPSIRPPPRTSNPPATARGIPRVGLIGTKPSNLFVKQQKPTVGRHNQPFKPPLLNAQQPIRSSPRRPSASIQTKTPSAKVMPTSHSKEIKNSIPALPKHVDKEDPSSDSIGDESFDSFDGMIEGGGEDVAALLRTLDGTQ